MQEEEAALEQEVARKKQVCLDAWIHSVDLSRSGDSCMFAEVACVERMLLDSSHPHQVVHRSIACPVCPCPPLFSVVPAGGLCKASFAFVYRRQACFFVCTEEVPPVVRCFIAATGRLATMLVAAGGGVARVSQRLKRLYRPSPR